MSFHPELADIKRIMLLVACICVLTGVVSAQEGPEPNGPTITVNKCWETVSAEPINGVLASDREKLYVPLSSGGIQAIDVKDGRSVWSTDLGGELGSEILVTDRALYIVSVNGSSAANATAVVRSISKQTGVTNWQEAIPASDRFFLGEVGGGIITISRTGLIELLSFDDGKSIWKASVPGPVSAEPHFSGDRLYIATGQKMLFVLSNTDGHRLYRRSVKFVPTAISTTPDGKLITGDERGNLSLYNTGGDLQWSFKNGARISSVEHTVHGILATSLDNFVYLLSHGSGSVIWKRRLPGRVFGKPAVTEKIAIATTVSDGRAFVMELESGKLINQMTVDNADSGRLLPLLVDDRTFAFALPAEVRLYSSATCG